MNRPIQIVQKIKRALRALWQIPIAALVYIFAILILIYIIFMAAGAFFEVIKIAELENSSYMPQTVNVINNYSKEFKDNIFFIIEVIAALLAGLFLIVMLREERGISILPFEVGSDYKEGYDGKEISNMLIAELQNIKRIHGLFQNELKERGSFNQAKGESTSYDDLHSDDLDYYMTNLGTIEFGSVSLPLGQILIGLRRFFPGSRPGKVITGSMQELENSPNLKTILIDESFFCSEVSLADIKEEMEIIGVEDNEREIVRELVKALSYRIAFHLSHQKIEAKTVKGFENYTRALDCYYRYYLIRDPNDLQKSKSHCILAAEAEPYYPNPKSLLMKIGSDYVDRNDLESSRNIFLNIIEQNPDDINALDWLGYVFELSGNGRDAEKYYKAASMLDPEDDQTGNNKGHALTSLGMHDEAIGYYNDVIDRHPDYPYAYKNRGKSLLLKGYNDEAIEDFQKSIKNFENYEDYLKASEICVELARAQCWLGKYDYAIKTYKKALKLNPKNIEARIALVACRKRERVHDQKSSCNAVNDSDESIQCEIIRKSIEKIGMNATEIIQARFYAVCGCPQESLRLLEIALDKKQCPSMYIQKDVDFEFMKNEIELKGLLNKSS